MQEQQNRRPRSKRNKLPISVGIIFLAFALIGIWTVGTWAYSGVQLLFDNSEQRREYENFIVPIVVVDPAPFNDISQLSSSDLFSICMWSILRDNSDTDTLEYDTRGMLIVPEDLLAEKCAVLFGREYNFNLEGIEYYGNLYEIDLEQKCAYAIVTSITAEFTPQIVSISTEEDATVLTVNYMSVAVNWDDLSDEYAIAPVKTYEYILRGEPGEQFISAVKAAPDTAAE